MAAEIDPVVFEFHARTNGYLADLKRTTRTVDQQMGLQEKRVRRLENEMRSSSGKISSTIKGLAGTLAAAFTGRELVGLLDSFTRLQNNLRTSGLEGEALEKVQARLLETSQRYGVELESLTSVFQKAALVQNELGASTEQILKLNEITAAALKITGSSAAEAQGALLQLGQALGSGVVRAEEFNSILEGALPLAQAAARGIDGFGGSVSKLRAAIADGQITSQQFFQGVLGGGTQTLAVAEKATLTLAGGLTALTSTLTDYFGKADKANGVSAALGGALGLLADNVGILIPAIATIATALGVGFVTNAVAARIAAAGVTGSLVSMTAAAQASRAALLAAFGGPVGIAITAIAIGLTYVATQAENAEAKTERLRSKAEQLKNEADQLEKNLKDAGVQVDNLGNSAGGASGGVDDLTRSMETARKKAAELADQAGFTANKLAALGFQEAKKERQSIENALRQAKTSRGSQTRTGDFLATNAGNEIIASLEQQLAGAKSVESAALRQQRLTAQAIGTGVTSEVPTRAGSGSSVEKKPKKTKTGGSGPSGPSAGDIEQRFKDELAGVADRALSAQISLATNIDDRAELELRGVEAARKRTLASIDADADYSQAQKDRLKAAVETLVFEERALIEFNRKADSERELADLAEESFRAAEDALRLQFELADTDAERRALAFKILAAEDEYLKSKLEAVIASDTIAEAEKNRARIALAGINDTAGARREVVARQNEGALARFARGTLDVDARIEELAVRKIQDINDTIADTMAKQFGIKDKFIADLLSVFLDQALFGPLAKGLSSAGGGGGLFGTILGAVGLFAGSGGNSSAGSTDGGVSGALGSIFGRASGGAVSAGQIYRVNEGASSGRVEAFQPSGSGDIIPLGRMDVLRGGGGGNQIVTVRLALSGDIDAKIDQRSAQVAVEVTRQAAPSIIDAASNETLRRSGRPRL